jgi:hypothetical protein
VGRKLATELARYGFDVKRVENAEIPKEQMKLKDLTMVLAQDKSVDASTAEFFATLLHTTVGASSEPIPAEQMEQVTVVIGKGYMYAPLQDLLPAE